MGFSQKSARYQRNQLQPRVTDNQCFDVSPDGWIFSRKTLEKMYRNWKMFRGMYLCRTYITLFFPYILSHFVWTFFCFLSDISHFRIFYIGWSNLTAGMICRVSLWFVWTIVPSPSTVEVLKSWCGLWGLTSMNLDCYIDPTQFQTFFSFWDPLFLHALLIWSPWPRILVCD